MKRKRGRGKGRENKEGWGERGWGGGDVCSGGSAYAYYQEYIIKEKRVSNFPIRSVEYVRKVTRLECKFY